VISPVQIKEKANKIWQTWQLHQAFLMEQDCFPLIISLPKLSAKLLQQEFSTIRVWIKALFDHSKQQVGHGYQVVMQEVKHRQLGMQTLPDYLEFSELKDFLCFINKQKEYQQFCQTVQMILAQQPSLKSWLALHPNVVLQYQHKWPQLLAIYSFLEARPKPQCYLRELDIPGIDTKLIEQHKKILTELLEQLLPASAINYSITQRGAHYFEKRYGFKYDEPLIRFRLLGDVNKTVEDMSSGFKWRDISLPLSEFQQLSLAYQRVFITENKINGLMFPSIKNAMVIFGLGYGIQSLRNIDWLQKKDIIYWGDIDTHGFAMLSQLRSYYPQTQSFLMDQTTLKKFKHLWVTEPADKRCHAELKYLQPAERSLYQQLKNNSWGNNIRLEQERISFNYVCTCLKQYENGIRSDCHEEKKQNSQSS
jgi:hypothetical protein